MYLSLDEYYKMKKIKVGRKSARTFMDDCCQHSWAIHGAAELLFEFLDDGFCKKQNLLATAPYYCMQLKKEVQKWRKK